MLKNMLMLAVLASPHSVHAQLTVVSTSPGNGGFDVATRATITVDLSAAVDPGTVSSNSFAVRGQKSGLHVGAFTYPTPSSIELRGLEFLAGELVTVTLDERIEDVGANSLAPHTFLFRVAPCCAQMTFTASQTLGDYPSGSVWLADFTGDTFLDAFFIVGSNLPDRLWINDGLGNLSDSGQMIGATSSNSLACGDLDGDGDVDAFVGTTAQGHRVYLNNGSGTMTDTGQMLGSRVARGMALGDLDGDGDLDAFSANRDVVAGLGEPNRVWFNDGAGNFTDSGQSIGNEPTSHAALGDFDGDGDLDVYITNLVNTSQTPIANQVWLNDGAGNFTDSGQRLGASISSGVALGDLDGDGDLDAYVVNTRTCPDEVYLGDGAGNFTDSGQRLDALGGIRVRLADFDDDGDLDAIVANNGATGMGQPGKIWLNDGAATFTDSGLTLGSTVSLDVAIGDLDQDGDIDAIMANNERLLADASQADRVWFHDGACPECGDCDRDGDVDILDALRAAQFSAGILTPTPDDLKLCDVDVDGDIDILDSLQIAQAAVGILTLSC